jgi:hypothetical protein
MRTFTTTVAAWFVCGALAFAQAPAAGAGRQGGRGAGPGQQGAAGGRQGGRGAAQRPPAGPIKRMPDGKPDLTGHYSGDAGGANYGLETSSGGFMLPRSRGIVLDPSDGKLP